MIKQFSTSRKVAVRIGPDQHMCILRPAREVVVEITFPIGHNRNA